MTAKVLVLPGDGIGPEIIAAALRVLGTLQSNGEIAVEFESAIVGGNAYDATGSPLPAETLTLAEQADAILFGSVGGPQWDNVVRAKRPEQGLLDLRSALGVFANLRPAIVYPQLVDASALKPEVVAGLDLLIVRELTGGIYFGQPRGIRIDESGQRQGFNTMVYSEGEIARICRVAFASAAQRQGRVCSVDKANVLEVSELWREVAESVAVEFPDVELTHMYVDNAAMQLVRNPKQFDVLVTTNMFGDILSDLASMLTGSIGLLPSASLDQNNKGMYEPIHGTAPDIAGQDVANPLATILSAAMMLRYSLGYRDAANRIEQAVGQVLERGLRTRDIAGPGSEVVGTLAMGEAVCAALGD